MIALNSIALALVLTGQGTGKITVPYEKYVLPNGMKVILHVDKTLPVATINTWFYVGSKDEAERRSGFAHLFEHLMFMGTKRVPTGQFDIIMESAGGFNNASTSEDRTNYYSFGPSNLLPTLLWLDADRLEDLAETMTLAKLDLQRDVVKNERRQNVENQPYGKAFEEINHLMFPKGHPYSTSVIGSHEDLSAATVEDVKGFFRTYYVPNNASLVVAGDFDPVKIKPLIAKLFGTLPRKNDVARKDIQPFKFQSKKLTMTDAVSAAKTIMVWHTPASGLPGDIEMSAAGRVLSSGLASRLQSKVVQELQLASDISASQSSQYLGSLFYIEATLANGQDLAKLEKAIQDVLREFATKGPTPDELKRVVATYETEVASVLQDIERKADYLNQFEFYYGEPDSFQRTIDDYRKLTPAKVAAAVKKYLVDGGSLQMRVIPEDEAAAQNPRDERPRLDPASAFASPKPTESVIGQKAPLQYWSRPGVPLLEVSLAYNVGTLGDPKGKEGLMNLAAEMIVRGAGKLNGAQFSAAQDELGASIQAGSSRQSTTISLQTPLSNKEKAIQLLAMALSSPLLAQEDFDQLKSEVIAGLEQENDSPGRIAAKVFAREYFGDNHPLSRPASGTIESVKAITLADIKTAVKQILDVTPTVYAASGLPVSEATPFLEKSLPASMLGKAPRKLTTIPSEVQQSKPRLLIVDRPNSVQTTIQISFPAVSIGDANYLSTDAAINIIGGGFTSRLNGNLREDKGYTYGAGARLNATQFLGWIQMSSSVRADVTGASLVEFMKEITRYQNGDITDAETGKAAQALRTQEVTSFSTLGQILGTAHQWNELGLDLKAVDARLSNISGLSTTALNDIAKKFVRKDRALIILVGDKTQILKQIEGMGLPTPEIVKP